MSGEAPEGTPLDVWLAANWVDVACRKNSCRDEGCNGFLCARAIRATYERGRKEGIEEAAKVVEKETEAPAQRNAKSMWVQDIGDRLATAIRQLLEGKG